MRNKNGFIATSLIYSFFLLFCGLLLSYVALFLHNNNLLDKVEEDMYNDLYSSKTLGDVSFASLVRLQLNNENPNLVLNDENNLFILLNDEESNNVNLVSYIPTFIFTSLENANSTIDRIKYNYNNNENSGFVSYIFSYPTFDRVRKKSGLLENNPDLKNLIFNSTYTDVVTNNTSCADNSNCLISTYLIGNDYYYEVWSDNIKNKEIGNEQVFDSTSVLTNDISIRLEFSLPQDLKIISGDGSLNSPYELGDL